ncbi:hypothetical protein HYU15_02495 [Candidatus Woesearchaeota archaeon]|nr:hypothetical protein [Candidatus Woesearchaeota archaeon]
MAQSFNDIFAYLDELGIADSLLPFLLIFTIVYAIMNKTKIIGEGKKNFNVIVSLILSLMVVVPHIMGRFPENQDPVVIMNTALPNISIILVAVFALLLLIGIFGQNLDVVGVSLGGWITVAAFAAVLWVFGTSAGWFQELPPFLDFLNDSANQSLIVMLLVAGFIIKFITADEKGVNVGGGLSGILSGVRDSIKKQ